MFKVRNISNGKIILGDLSIIVNKGAEIDLDLLAPRDKLEQSPSLHRCLQPEQNKLQLLHKDVSVPQMSADAVAAIESRLRNEIAEQLTLQQMPQDNGGIDDIKKQMELLINLVKNQQQSVATQSPATQMPTKEDETTENAEKSIAIQEKLIKRLSSKAESQVETKQETKQSAIKNRTNELEDLL